MGEYGLEIKNIQAAPLYEYNLGVRDRYDSVPAMFNKSLFYYFLEKNGLQTYKDESTRDIICIDFGFGARSYEEEMAHLNKMQKECSGDSEAEEKIKYLIDKAEKNKLNYDKKSKDELRYLFYKDGVPVKYKRTNKITGEVTTETINYRMLYRNPSKAKQGLCNFINEELYEKAHDWLTMGIDKYMPEDNAMIVELSAYSTLVTSSIEGSFYLDVDDVLFLNDQDSFFKTVADIVKSADYDTTERVIDNEKTEANKRRAIERGKLDVCGNPIYKIAYKKVPVTKKRCIVSREETEVKNAMWDGMALMDDSVFPDYCNGMALLRNHFFKACAFRTYIQKFFRDYCLKHNIDYETYEIEDMFGQKHLAKNIKMITTDNAWKIKKFAKYFGGLEETYEYWKQRVRMDGCIFGIVKHDKPSKLGDVQQLSYQAINTLPCTYDDIEKICGTSLEYINLLKNDDAAYEKYLRSNANVVNHYEMMADLYAWNHEFANSRLFRKDRTKIISKYLHKLRGGKITVNGDNLTVCGNPYALLLYTVSENWEDDPCLRPEDGVIQVYTKRFDDGEYLCGIRSPHNSANNIGYFKNVRHPIMDNYFNFSNNIMAVNCIHTDVQSRMNGEDFDSDFNFVTNQSEMVKAAKYAYENYPTVVNALEESGLKYRNVPGEYAKMDSIMAAAQKAIGGSSDSAQLAQSYYWTRIAKGINDSETQELYENIIILAVLAQVSIDGCKKTFSVDANSEIARIRDMNCMRRSSDGKLFDKKNKQDFPEFWIYTHDVPVIKNGNERSNKDIHAERDRMKRRVDCGFICPMNWVQECLDKAAGMNRLPRSQIRDVTDFYILKSGQANAKQMPKIRKMIEEYDHLIRNNTDILDDDDRYYILLQKTDDILNMIRSRKVSDFTMNRLIGAAFGIFIGVHKNKQYVKAKKLVLRTLSILHRADKEKFLSNFVQGAS